MPEGRVEGRADDRLLVKAAGSGWIRGPVVLPAEIDGEDMQFHLW